MHMLLRTLWIFLLKRTFTKVPFLQETEYTMRVLPVDLDLLMHVNNGVYFSYMDFGRWNMIFRNRAFEISREKGWYSVVAGETIKFRRSLKLWDKFTIKTQTVGHDDKYFFIRQSFFCKGQEMATGLVKVRFLKRSGGTVPIEEVLREFNLEEKRFPELSGDWALMENRYLS